jgi:hypothetical protein
MPTCTHARHHHPGPAASGQGRAGRRRPGVHEQYGHQAPGAQGAPHLQRSILVGFAGATADAMNLSERLEAKLERYNGNLTRAPWNWPATGARTRSCRRLEALMIAADPQKLFLISGTGDVIEPDEGVIGIGSGGVAAQAAATALMRHTTWMPPGGRGRHAHRRQPVRVHQRTFNHRRDDIVMQILNHLKSSPNWTATSSARTRPNVRWPSPCATAGAPAGRRRAAR